MATKELSTLEQCLNYLREAGELEVRDQRKVLSINLSLNGSLFSFSDFRQKRYEKQEELKADGKLTVLVYSLPLSSQGDPEESWTTMAPKELTSPELKRVKDYALVEFWNESGQRYMMYWNKFVDIIQKQEMVIE